MPHISIMLLTFHHPQTLLRWALSYPFTNNKIASQRDLVTDWSYKTSNHWYGIWTQVCITPKPVFILLNDPASFLILIKQVLTSEMQAMIAEARMQGRTGLNFGLQNQKPKIFNDKNNNNFIYVYIISVAGSHWTRIQSQEDSPKTYQKMLNSVPRGNGPSLDTLPFQKTPEEKGGVFNTKRNRVV